MINFGTVAIAVGVAVVILRLLTGRRRSSGRFPLGFVIFLVVVWLGAARHSNRQNQPQQSWPAQQEAMAKQNAAIARQMAMQQAAMGQQLAESQARVIEHATKSSAKQFALKMDAAFDMNQRVLVPMPNVPAPPTAKAWVTPTPNAWATPAAPAKVALTVPVAPLAPAPTAASLGQVPLAMSGRPATWVMVIPVGFAVAALFGFLASRRVRHAGGGSGIGLVSAGVALMAIAGLFFMGSIRTGKVVHGEQVAEEAFDHGVQDGVSSDLNAEGLEPIDAIWDRLSAPKIELQPEEAAFALKEVAVQVEQMSPKQVTAAQAKLNEAARVLELAAEGMNESNSQGWLVVMAEALLKATAKTSAVKPVAAVEAAPAKQVANPLAADAAWRGQPPRPVTPAVEKMRSQLGRRTPDWVVHSPGIVGEVRKIVVEGGPYKTLGECHRDLELKMRSVVQARIIDLVKSTQGSGASVPTLQALGIGTDYILRELCTEEFVETKEFDFGEMLTAHALMEFNAAQDAALVDRWTVYARRAGVERTALGASLIVGCLALVFGLLKLDTWTRGYYTKRLFLGVPAAIIAITVLLSLA